MLDTAARGRRMQRGDDSGCYALRGKTPVPISCQEWSRQIDLEQGEGVDPEGLAETTLPAGDRVETRFVSLLNDWDERGRPLHFVTFLADSPRFPRTEIAWYSASWDGAMATHRAVVAALRGGRLLVDPPAEP